MLKTVLRTLIGLAVELKFKKYMGTLDVIMWIIPHTIHLMHPQLFCLLSWAPITLESMPGERCGAFLELQT